MDRNQEKLIIRYMEQITNSLDHMCSLMGVVNDTNFSAVEEINGVKKNARVLTQRIEALEEKVEKLMQKKCEDRCKDKEEKLDSPIKIGRVEYRRKNEES